MNSLELGLCYSIHLCWGRYREIARQTGFDSIEIELVQPYSTDYNTFLESYDFSNKTIMPFCSHEGGRFGQSLTAISKLAPKATLTAGLSIHYTGGFSLSKDVEKWLKKAQR